MRAWIAIGLVTFTSAASAGENDRPQLAPDDHPTSLIMVQTLSRGAPRAWEGTRIVPVAYAEEMAGGRVQASLNGRDVSGLFHPPAKEEVGHKGGKTEQVDLPLEEGSNRLEITVTPLGRDGQPDPEQSQIHSFTIEVAERKPPHAQTSVSVHKLKDKAAAEAFMRDFKNGKIP
jgi:hypothetical protein